LSNWVSGTCSYALSSSAVGNDIMDFVDREDLYTRCQMALSIVLGSRNGFRANVVMS
jgi:L-fucose mutarotase/ribose pyranase (RbsD/FucU family)